MCGETIGRIPPFVAAERFGDGEITGRPCEDELSSLWRSRGIIALEAENGGLGHLWRPLLVLPPIP